MSVTLTLTETPPRISSLDPDVASNMEEEEGEGREADLITFENTTHGLGLKVCGGHNADSSVAYGIFVKKVLPGGLAEASGEISVGDLLLEVNGENMKGVTYERAVTLLRHASASNHVELVVTRDKEARNQFEDYVTRCGPLASPYHGNSDHAADSDVELQKELGSVLMEAGFGSNDFRDQNIFSHVDPKDSNGHVSPSLSGSNRSSDLPTLPHPWRGYTNGYGRDHHKPSSTPDSINHLMSRRLSQDPCLRLHVSQLESATASLGLRITPATQASLRRQLKIDKDGRVPFSDFVDAARVVFHNDLEPGIILPRKSQPEINEVTETNPSFESHMEVVRERDQLRQEVTKLKEELRTRNQATHSAEEQLLTIRKQAQASIEECRALKIKLHLAQEAHSKAQQTECDYEEVVAMLENEVAQLRLQMSKSDAVNMQKRLAVLVCQLKKAEMGKKTYEVATDKLTKFVEHSLETLSSLDGSPRLAVDSNKINKKKALQTLSTEAREVIKTVRSLMETVPLPFGWEEAYTAEGVKYYINHLNQTTTWTHPVSSMQHPTPSSGGYLHQQSQQEQTDPTGQHLKQLQSTQSPPFHQLIPEEQAANPQAPQRSKKKLHQLKGQQEVSQQ